jgi:glycosyltransferase involved in cell wall biosynthesis
MKLTHILYSGIGGHGTVVRSLLEGDVKKVNDYQLIFSGVVPLAEEHRQLCREWGIDEHYVPYNSRFLPKTYCQVIGKLRLFKPDVIVMHSVSLILPVFIYRCLFGGKIMAVEHQTNSFKKWTEWVYSKLVLLLSDAVVYLSENYKGEIIKSLNVKSARKLKKMHVINNGINTNHLKRYERQDAATDKTRFNISYCSRFIPLKDFDTFIFAAKILLDQNPDKWHFTLAGDGPESERIQDLVHKNGLSRFFSLPGFINHEKIAILLSQSDIYLHTSKHENMSTAILQAMAQKVPVIASDIPGNRVLIEHLTSGILCPAGDANAFAQACELLMNDTTLRKSIIRNAYHKVQINYSHTKMFDDYQRLATKLSKIDYK